MDLLTIDNLVALVTLTAMAFSLGVEMLNIRATRRAAGTHA